MTLFDNADPDEFLLFVQNFKMMLEASRILIDNTNIQYLRTILRGEALHQFDILCVQVGSTKMSHLNWLVLDLGD